MTCPATKTNSFIFFSTWRKLKVNSHRKVLVTYSWVTICVSVLTEGFYVLLCFIITLFGFIFTLF